MFRKQFQTCTASLSLCRIVGHRVLPLFECDVDLFVALFASQSFGIASVCRTLWAAVSRAHRAATFFRLFFLQRCLCRGRVKEYVGNGSVIAARVCDGECFVEAETAMPRLKPCAAVS